MPQATTKTRRRPPTTGAASVLLPSAEITRLDAFLADSLVETPSTIPPPTPSIEVTSFSAFVRASIQETPKDLSREIANYPDPELILKEQPHKGGPEYYLRTRVFTEKEIADLLKRCGASKDDIDRECSLAFAAASAHQPENTSSASADDVPEEAQDTPLARLSFRYAKRLEAIILPQEGFSSEEQAREAARLSETYRHLKNLQERLGVPVTPKDPRVAEADRLRVAYRRQLSKEKEPLVYPAIAQG